MQELLHSQGIDDAVIEKKYQHTYQVRGTWMLPFTRADKIIYQQINLDQEITATNKRELEAAITDMLDDWKKSAAKKLDTILDNDQLEGMQKQGTQKRPLYRLQKNDKGQMVLKQIRKSSGYQ